MAPGTSAPSQATRREEAQWTATTTIPGLDRVVAALGDRVNVPITLPPRVPRGTRLDSRHPVRFYGSAGRQTGILHLVVGRKKHLYVQYGQATFDGCGGDRAEVVTVAGDPGLLDVSPIATWSQLIWPAVPGNPQGRYGLAGSFSGVELLALAESMEPYHGVLRHSALRGC
jgi:hypothetical protein